MIAKQLNLRGRFLLPLLACAISTSHAEDGNAVVYNHAKANQALRQFGEAEYESGKALYEMVCIACHGDLKRPAIDETARRFHEAPLQNGYSPVEMYETLTKGFKNMAPQPWMNARQKYEVIHYIREAFFKEHNPSQYFPITGDYLKGLIRGKGGPARFPWPAASDAKSSNVSYDAVDLGKALFGHFEVSVTNYAPKGLIVSLDPNAASVSSSKQNALYDLDTGRLAAFWKGGPITWTDLSYDGQHSANARVAGEVAFETPMGLSWAAPQKVSPGQHVDLRDPRDQALDGRFYGPLPRGHVQYQGLFLNSGRPQLRFRVNDVEVTETPWLLQYLGSDLYIRTIQIAPHEDTMYLRFRGKNAAVAAKHFLNGHGKLIGSERVNDGIIEIQPSKKPATMHFAYAAFNQMEQLSALEAGQLLLDGKPAEEALPWAELPSENTASYVSKDFSSAPSVTTKFVRGSDEGSFKVDDIPLPQNEDNPWKTRIRPSGIDFLDEDTAAFCSWTGDVFVAENIRGAKGDDVRISRIATGLHQPLGLKVRDGEIFVSCRDQIVRLHDLDGDAVADYYEAFNSDHMVTMHFHEFAAGLDTDAEGNFYYVKCSQHQAPAVHPQHGTIIKVSPDGKKSEIIANGLRSCNGMFVDDDGAVWLTDQEGYWIPQNKIMRVKPGAFHGNMLGWHDDKKVSAADSDMVEPMVWTPKTLANSPSEVFRFPSEGWGALNSRLGYCEYGRGQLMILADEEKNEQLQGFTHSLDLPAFPTGIMRARFHPGDHSLYTCGMFSWGSNRTQLGGLYRVTPAGKPSYSLVGIETSPGKLHLRLSDPVERDAQKPEYFEIKSYDIVRSGNYGSSMDDETVIPVKSLAISEDGCGITLEIPGLKPSRIIIINAKFTTSGGPVERQLIGSLYNL